MPPSQYDTKAAHLLFLGGTLICREYWSSEETELTQPSQPPGVPVTLMAVPPKPPEPVYLCPRCEPGYQPLGLMDRGNKETLSACRLDRFVKLSQLISPMLPLRQMHQDAFSVVPSFTGKTSGSRCPTCGPDCL